MNKFEIRHVLKPSKEDKTGKVTECHWKDDEGINHAANFPGFLEKNTVKAIIEDRMRKFL